MKIKILVILALMSFSFLGCEKEESPGENLNEDDYIVFGQFFGFCFGEECIEIFKIENETLFEDTLDQYPLIDSENPYPGDFEELSNAQYQSVADLKDFFPEELLVETERVLGIPDAGDWGGYYVEVKENGVKKHWRIDTMKDNIPEYLHEFTDKIQAAISTIND